MDIFGDFGFVGGENKTADQYQDSQTCINWYPELSPSETSKTAIALLGCPGLIQVVAAPGGGNPGTFGGPIIFGNGDGTTTAFLTGDSNLALEKVYISDWEGLQTQYTTSRTNLVTYSQDGTHWTASNANIAANQSGAPDGTATLNKISQTATLNAHEAKVTCTSATIPTGTYSARWIVKSGIGANYAECVLADQNGGHAIAVFSFITNSLVSNPYLISTLPKGNFTVVSTTSYAIGSGCYAVEMTAVKNDSNFAIAIELFHNNGTTDVFTGNTSFYFYGWGLMVTAGTTIGSYIATIGSAASLIDYTVSGTNVLFTNAPVSGALLEKQTFTPGATSSTTWPQPSSITNLPVRGMWVLPGAATALVVIANTCYLATSTVQGATQTPGKITLTSVGTLLTNTGPVCIRDNNAGGYAVIVDGANGYTYNLSTQAFAQITQAQFTSFGGASTVAYIDGWWIFSKPNSQIFYTNAPIYSTSFDATYFALKDGASDNLMAIIDNKEELWLIGERTTEIWYNAGGQYFPFQRLAGNLQQFGCKAIYSFARLKSGAEDALIWLGRSERGENIVLKTQGFTTQVVSTPAVSDAISTYTITSDAIGYSYEEDGHEFYVLTFPNADRTWVYDSTVPPEFAWHQRLSYDPYANQYHRHRSNCFMNFGGMRIVGDYQNGVLYQMTRAAYTDAGWPIRCQRKSPFIWDKDNRERMHMASLQVEFSPGQGNASGMGTTPQAKLRISRDYGTTFGTPIYAAMGAIGQFVNRCIWRKLGWTRGTVAEIEVIDPVKRDIVGVTLRANGG